VPDVAAYPGHIACDGETNSEIVIPLLVSVAANRMGHAAEFGDVTARAVGVLDLDCLALEGFNEEDRVGLERIAKLVVESCDW
jgi:L-methionine (R)-S-oxide reductase